MSRFNTGNPLGSGSPLDLDDNAKNFDALTNSREALSNPDRFGVQRKTWHGMERDYEAAQSSREAVFSDFLQASGYQDLGEYAPGIEITAHNQYVTFGGQPYLLKPSIHVPYTTSGEWAGDDFKLIGDDALRQDLTNPDKGAAMVARASQFAHTTEFMESLSLDAGSHIYLTESGREGGFIVREGVQPFSDPSKGFYIPLGGGFYAERQSSILTLDMFGGDSAVQACLNFASVSKKPVLLTREHLTPAFNIPSGVVLAGSGPHTGFTRSTAGDYILGIGAESILMNLRIFGNAGMLGAGLGALIKENEPRQKMYNVVIRGFAGPALRFEGLGGSGFSATACTFSTDAPIGTIGAVEISPDFNEDDAVPRSFYQCEGVGATLFDFGGGSDTFVSGGYSNGMLFGSGAIQPNKVFWSGMRIGAAAGTVTVRGAQHQIKGNVFAVPVILDETTINVDFDSSVPDDNITNLGTRNNIKQAPPFTPAITSGLVINSGRNRALVSRVGRRVDLNYYFRMAVDTAYAAGEWRFSVPFPPDTFRTYSGVATAFDASTGKYYTCSAILLPTTAEIRVVFNDSDKLLSKDNPFVWASMDELYIFLSYNASN